LRYGNLLGELLSFADRSGLSSLGVLLVKILAIAYLTTLAADVCRELGEASLGARVEWCGKAEILLLCLPKFWELAELALGLIEGI
jgi:stage III sporulation protein AD